ncbi:hypothetical protein APHAL10511_000115 [Amanita phalloides]|nr:hypothetical protein APHAL10511_000115 [Amanita phalloides]
MSAALRPRPARHHPSAHVDDDDDDDQPTPRLSSNTALAAETPAARLRALLARVPNKPSMPLRFDLVDSDVDPPDDYQRPPFPSTSLSLARESLRDIFLRARRDPGDTPQKDKTLRPRRSSFDELDSVPNRAHDRPKRPGKRKSLSDEELEILPSDLRQSEFVSGSGTMSIDNLREKLLVESQTQLQDQSLQSLYEQSASTSNNLNISQATPPDATSTPQAFPRKYQMDSNLPSQLDSQIAQSNLLDTDSEMQQAIRNVESEGEYGSEFEHVPFPPGAQIDAAKPPTSPPGSTPSRSRIPLTRSRLNSFDKAYAGIGARRASGEVHRPVSRTSSISSSMSFCSDEAERIRERERDWNKPKAPVRPSTPELRQGHKHGRFSSRTDSPMVGGSSARRASITSINGVDDQSSVSSQAEPDVERMHERERQWNKRRPRFSYPSPGSLSNERTRTISLTQAPRSESAMSISSTTSLQRPHSSSPSGMSPSGRMGSEPPEEYLHERERNWNAPRPKWFQSPDAANGTHLTSWNGRQRADSLRSTDELDSPSHSRSKSYLTHPEMELTPTIRTIDPPSESTPPRTLVSSNSANFEFPSPSPPKGLPELPDPPSMSYDEEDVDYNSIAWEQTPGQQTAEHTSTNVGNLTTMKTPRPPGAWLATPAPTDRTADRVANPHEPSPFSAKIEYGGGLATPVASLSRTSALHTPAIPGAWMPTPATATRKSILRVRFEQPPSDSTDAEQIATTSENSDYMPETSNRSPSPANKISRPVEPLPEVRSRTPELQAPLVKPMSPKSPRKSPKIRVLDAFGREASDHVPREVDRVDVPVNTPRSRSTIRFVDAMGREVDMGANEGLSDLAQGIDDINNAKTEHINEVRIRELEELSRSARNKRENLATRLHAAETNLPSKTHNAGDAKLVTRRALRLPSGFIWILLVMQTILIFVMYHLAMKQAKDIFLSTYYDPFYPDLHLYTIRPDTHRHQLSSSSSWMSILDTFRRDGFGATFALFWDKFSIFTYDLRTQIWETWGEGTTQQVASWPPT